MEYEERLHPVLGIRVSSDGRILVPATKFSKEHWTTGSLHNNGYMSVKVNYKEYLVHRLVAETFIPNPEGLPQVDHINRVKHENSVTNLRWVSRSTNQRNTAQNDRCRERLGINYFEDRKEANRRKCHLWYEENKEEISRSRREKRAAQKKENKG